MTIARTVRGGRLVVGACVVLVVALRLISGGGESASGPGPVRLPAPTPTADELCQLFARYWTVETGGEVPAEAVAAISDCRQDTSGAWFQASGPDDPRLAGGPVLSDDERARTAGLRGEITDQLDALLAGLPESLRRSLDGLYDPVGRPGSGHLRDGQRITQVRTSYERFVRRYLADPGHQAIADYVVWLTAWRAAAFDHIRLACREGQPLVTGCSAMATALAIGSVPWPWDLRDPLALDAYLASTLEPGT